MTKTRTRPKTYEAEMGGKKVRVTVPESDDLVAETDACPKCGERNVDNLVWQENGKVKCTTCGKRYTPPAK